MEFINRKAYKLLVMGRVTTHFQPKLSQLLEKENWKYSLIPPGLTRFSQLLDIIINYPMKQYLITYDVLFRINTLNATKPTDEDIINKVYEIWNEDTKITKEMIYKSFIKPGITVKLDNTEKNLINISEDLISQSEIPDPDSLINEEELNNENEIDNINKINECPCQTQSSLLEYNHPDQDMDFC